PLTVKGKARGFWFFEADFPVRLLDSKGKEITIGIARADGEWMTDGFVPFSVTLSFQAPETQTGIIALEKANASGLPEHDDELRVPISFKEPQQPKPKDGCLITGCSGQVCLDEQVITTCEYLPEYDCYRKAFCERQSSGECGWTMTEELKKCLEEK
ncbi:MAG: Gmad2 immunoglobulin-like domain-containing protein, partial [Patescibacteria group bacterium]